MIIVIDGPAGSGKSSTAKEIANRLNIQFLDSGALYRTVTLLWLRQNKPDKSRFFENLSTVQLQSAYVDRLFRVEADGEDVTDEIRTQHVAEHVSEIASDPKAREFVNQFMRSLVERDTFVADGRDLGTAVFPDADLKFYMDASIAERAKRRFNEMRQADPKVTLEQVKQNLEDRDRKDSSRKHDPLKRADDAIVIDTTGKTFEEQVSEMISIIQDQLNIN
jgi:CMP/dCMP kinase